MDTLFIQNLNKIPLDPKKIAAYLAPYKQYLEPDDAKNGHHEPTCQHNHPSKSTGPQNYKDQGQEGIHVFNKSYHDRA